MNTQPNSPGRAVTSDAVPPRPAAPAPGAISPSPWAASPEPAAERVTSRLRRTVEELPDWEPLPPGETVVRRPGGQS